jgi:protein O-GlcNAc transferase
MSVCPEFDRAATAQRVPHARDAEIEQLKRLHSSGETAAAVEIASQLLHETFSDKSTVLLIGQALANANLHAESAEFLGRYSASFPKDVVLHHNLGVSLHVLKRLPEALKAFRTAIAWKPGSDLSISMAGNVLREMGRMEEAMEFHAAAVRLNPENAHALYSLGDTLVCTGEHAAAEQAYRQALQKNPGWQEALSKLAESLLQQGKFTEAMPYLFELSKRNPAEFGHRFRAVLDSRNVPPGDVLGENVFSINKTIARTGCASREGKSVSEQGDAQTQAVWEPAEKVLSTVPGRSMLLRKIEAAASEKDPLPAIHLLYEEVQSQPDLRESLEKIGLEEVPHKHAWKPRSVIAELIHKIKGRDASEAWIRSTFEGPCDARDWLWLAILLARCDAEQPAVKALETACSLEAVPAKAFLLLANHYATRRQMSEAEDFYRKAISHSPSLWQAHLNLSAMLFKQGLFRTALEVAKPASKFSDDTDLWLNLSTYESMNGLFFESLKTLEKVLQRKPDSSKALARLGVSLWGLGMVPEAILACEKAIALDPEDRGNHDQLLHIINYLPDLDVKIYFEKHRVFSRCLEEPLLRKPTLTNTRDPRKRLRIAYLSPDFREHSVSYFIEPIVRAHSRSEFEVYGIFTSTWRDSTTDRIEKLCDQWVDAASMTDEALAERLQKEGIDILVDLACHSSGNRLLIFPLRPAPIQITMIGMQQTSGLLSMDYRVTDSDLDPPGMTEEIHSEKLMRLKRGFVFLPPESNVIVKPLPALRAGHITFGSFNNFAKANPLVLGAWASILNRVPGSRLGAVVPQGAAFEEYFENAGIPAERIFRMHRQNGDAYLRMHDSVDIALDCFPFSGLTVSLFAAWMGVPTVTIAGRIPSARGGVSVCSGLGLGNWIASDPQDFVERAVAFASNWDALAELRGSMRQRMSVELTNGPLFAQDYEQHLRRAWQTWCLANETKYPE